MASKLSQSLRFPAFLTETPIEWDFVKKFRETGVMITIEKSQAGKKLKEPVNVTFMPNFNKADISLMNYILDSLIPGHGRLVQWVINNESVVNLAKYYWLHKTGSRNTLKAAVMYLHTFSQFLGLEPDEMLGSILNSEGEPIPKQVKKLKKDIEDFQAYLKAEGKAPTTINLATTMIKSWLDVNGVDVGKIVKPTTYVKNPDRAPTPEEISKLIDMASLREKAMISILALSGLRIGTLVNLQYKHVKTDLEAGRVPVCIQIKAEETKGKYADYFTFIGKEAVDYLKLYLEERRMGSLDGKIPPEEIRDDSPLFRTREDRDVKPLTYDAAYKTIHNLMIKAGLVSINKRGGYELRPHSLRKYFKTQLTAKGVPQEYIEFMMGHKVSTYQDVKSLGIEKLREIYLKSGISIRPQTKTTKLDMLKEIVRSLGLDPEKVLVKDAILEPHRTIIDESREIEVLQGALREWVKKIAKEASV